MNAGGYSLAFVAGVVAALNPCGFAMLPGYLGLVAGQWGSTRAVARGVAAAAAMTLGFMAVFGIFALLAISVAGKLQQALPYVTVLIGAVLIAVGVRQLMGRTAGITGIRLPQWNAPAGTVRSMVGYGVVYALVSLSCTVAPFLAVTGIGLGTGGRVWGAFSAYAAGFATLVGFVAVVAALAGSVLLRGLHRGARFVPRAGAVLLIVTGLYVGYYGIYEVRLRDMAGPDPVITAAARVQTELVRWAYPAAHSTAALVLAVALAVTVVVLIVLSVRKRVQRKE